MPVTLVMLAVTLVMPVVMGNKEIKLNCHRFDQDKQTTQNCERDNRPRQPRVVELSIFCDRLLFYV